MMLTSRIKPVTGHFLSFVMVIALLNITGCSVTSRVWPPYDKVLITADKNVNPDINNRPSPVEVKIYELSSRTTFDNLDFDGLFNHPDAQLSDELLSKLVFFLQPNETLKHKIKMQKETSYIAVLAAYRDIDNIRWKHIYKVKSHGHYRHKITLSADGIVAGKVVEETEKDDKENTRERKKNKKENRQKNPTEKENTKTKGNVKDKGEEKTKSQNTESKPTLVDSIKEKTTEKALDKVL